MATQPAQQDIPSRCVVRVRRAQKGNMMTETMNRSHRLIACIMTALIGANTMFGAAAPVYASSEDQAAETQEGPEVSAGAAEGTAEGMEAEEEEDTATGSDGEESGTVEGDQTAAEQDAADESGLLTNGDPADETEEPVPEENSEETVSAYHEEFISDNGLVAAEADGAVFSDADVSVSWEDAETYEPYTAEDTEILCALDIMISGDGRDLYEEEDLYFSITDESFRDRDSLRIFYTAEYGESITEENELREDTDADTGRGCAGFPVRCSGIYLVAAEKAAEETPEESSADATYDENVHEEGAQAADDKETEESMQGEDGRQADPPDEDAAAEEKAEDSGPDTGGEKDGTKLEGAGLRAGTAVVTVYSRDGSVVPEEMKDSGIILEEGLEPLTFFVLSEKDSAPAGKKKTLKKEKKDSSCVIEVRAEEDRGGRESIVLYRVTEDKTAEPVGSEDGTSYTVPEEGSRYVVVRDTGYRHMNLEADAGDEKHIALEGVLPKETSLETEDVSGKYEKERPDGIPAEEKILAAYDISLREGENEYEPDKDHPVNVTFTGIKTEKDRTYYVWHIKDDGTVERADGAEAGDGVISFTASGFSVYAVTEGPGPYVHGEVEDASDIGDLTGDRAEGGFLMSVTRGTANSYYFRNSVDTSQHVFPTVTDIGAGDIWYLEENDGKFLISTDAGGKKYVKNDGGNFIGLTDSINDAGQFIITNPAAGLFLFRLDGTNKYIQYSNGGKGIRFYDGTGNAGNSRIRLTYADSVETEEDVYSLDGAVYGLMNYSDGVSGHAVSGSGSGGTLLSSSMAVRPDTVNGSGMLYVTQDSDISEWTFHSMGEDKYRLSVETDDGIKYMHISNSSASLSDEDEASVIRFVPGTGQHAGQFRLVSGGRALMAADGKFKAASDNASDDRQWLNFVEKTQLTNDDFVIYSAQKVGVSDREKVSNGSGVIIYMRKWNEEAKKYEFYAVDHDGSLVRCYETGDSIEWVGNRINTLVWNFTEYYWEGTDTPNGYYELKNRYSGEYMSPKIGEEGFLSDDVVGLNMYGRQYGDYYTTIIAWDDPRYAYAGLKTEDGHVVSCPFAESEDFYFAIVQNESAGELTPVATVDHTGYGITMKLVDFGGSNSRQNTFLGSSAGGANVPPTQGLLSTDLGPDGYPTAAGGSLRTLYAGANEVNHLFIDSILNGTGYFEFDSTENFASIQDNGDFAVYKELGTTDNASKPSLKHGQFFPYDRISPDRFASVNSENLYEAELSPLNDTDPRKYEKMFLVPTPNYYFGMEIEASFVQTPSGLDAWGHDIIYEFTGDDDFWLYVDGELVIDLGGIHSALPGSVNYCTGEVSVNGTRTTLKQVFENNYRARGMNEEQISARINELFEQNSNGQYIFKDYSAHTMKIFFMERGAGASNLHMRFNLSSIKRGQVLLRKKISGTEKNDYKLAEYAYQVWYRTEEDEEYRLLSDKAGDGRPNVTYQNTNAPVKYRKKYRIAGGAQEYDNCFFLTPNQTAGIMLPEGTVSYRVVECGVNTQVYDSVSINGAEASGTPTEDEGRYDFDTGPKDPGSQKQTVFDNHVSGSAKRVLTITKKLYDTGNRLITDDPTEFRLRLYLGNENDEDPAAAGMQEYYIKDHEGYYCRWDSGTQSFVSVGKRDYDSLSESERQAITFHTSPNGTISRIPAEYKVEVRDLLVGTRFKVEERENEIPEGYSFIEYVRDAASYIVEDGDTVNTGIIRDNDSPAVEVHNRRGFGLTVKKEWSDADYVDSHGSIFTAVYVRGQLFDGSVRQIRHPETSAYYYWDSLADGTSLSDYSFREVTVSGGYTVDDNGNVSVEEGAVITPIEENGTARVHAVWNGTSEDDFEYRVSYKMGSPSGYTGNVRTDRIINTRKGVRILKTDMDGNALSGARFTLKDADGNNIGKDSFVSDENGLVTTAYLDAGKEYTLTETGAPKGYTVLDDPVTLMMDNTGNISTSGGGELIHTDAETVSVTVKNRMISLDAVNVGTWASGRESPLPGSSFSLYRGADTGGGPVMEYHPLAGYESLASAEGTAVIDRIDQSLPAGAYYLKQDEVKGGYVLLQEPICFVIDDAGRVTLPQTNAARIETEESGGTVHYRIVVINRKLPIIETGFFIKAPFIMVLLPAAVIIFMDVRRRLTSHRK